MKTQHSQKGFTLVELAIVMTIIGLLIGGILKGQELMENARVTSTIAQVKSYQAAVTTFRDQYSAYPGDMVSAATRLPNCIAACTAALPATSQGDAVVGTADGYLTDQSGVTQESTLMWTHLLKADLITGVTDATATGATIAWGSTHPAANIGGGFVAGDSDGTTSPPGITGAADSSIPTGLVLVLQTSPTVVPTNTAGTQPLTPLRAAQIDRKLDDGAARTGSVVGYGLPASCGGAAGATYVEGETNTDCGLIISIDG